MAGFTNWQLALLNQLGVPLTHENLQFLTAWQQAEGGAAKFNPLNTTRAGGTPYNSANVQNYANPNSGLHQTLATLRNGYYAAIINQLKTGNPHWTEQVGHALNKWGTGSAWMADYRKAAAPVVPWRH